MAWAPVATMRAVSLPLSSPPPAKNRMAPKSRASAADDEQLDRAAELQHDDADAGLRQQDDARDDVDGTGEPGEDAGHGDDDRSAVGHGREHSEGDLRPAQTRCRRGPRRSAVPSASGPLRGPSASGEGDGSRSLCQREGATGDGC